MHLVIFSRAQSAVQMDINCHQLRLGYRITIVVVSDLTAHFLVVDKLLTNTKLIDH